jgi:hypothetical protein
MRTWLESNDYMGGVVGHAVRVFTSRIPSIVCSHHCCGDVHGGISTALCAEILTRTERGHDYCCAEEQIAPIQSCLHMFLSLLF